MQSTVEEQSMQQDMIGEGGLVTINEAAAFLGVCGATVVAMLKRGELPALRVGKRARRIPRKALVEYANRRLSAGL
jgi:excisionase family DNA binding protein